MAKYIRMLVYAAMVCFSWVQISTSQINSEGYFVPLNLDGYQIKSPIKTIGVQTMKQCILMCLGTTGCSAVAMINNTCQPFNGDVYETQEYLYSQAYRNEGLLVSCLDELTPEDNVEIRKTYPYLHGYVTLTCSHGYIHNETTMTTDNTCNWTGSQPTCLKSYQWENNSYVFVPGRHNWSESYFRCKSLGGRLTDIQSTEENAFILTTIDQNSYTDSFWTGGYRVDGTTFMWTDINETVQEINWYHGDPNNAGQNENCISLYSPGQYHMVDELCGNNNGYICKIL